MYFPHLNNSYDSINETKNKNILSRKTRSKRKKEINVLK